MKNIIKVLAVILALAMMTVFATSCGSNKKDKDTSSKFSFDKFDEDDVDFDEDYDLEDEDDYDFDVEEDEDDDSSVLTDSSYETVEDYLNSPTGTKEFDAIKEQFEGTLDVDAYAVNNDMYYDYKYLTQYDDSSIETIKKSLDESLETNASVFDGVVDTMELLVTGEVTLTVIYRNADGTVITERSYTN